MISFIMMAKNEANRIGDAIESLIGSGYKKFELIVIDDHSSDTTFELVESYANRDSRIKIFKNKYKGKVRGTNYGYDLCTGDFIKCIDADDVLLPNFFETLDSIQPGFSHCHAATIVTSGLDPIAKYSVNPAIVRESKEKVISSLISLPKGCWTFSKEVADKVFPLPPEMPIEDLWMSLRAKEYSKEILASNESCYLYRQHEGQDYGGILNYNYKLVKLRAERSMQAIKVLNGMPQYSDQDFSYLVDFLKVCISRPGLKTILVSNLIMRDKFKLILILRFPNFASYATIFKWKLDAWKGA